MRHVDLGSVIVRAAARFGDRPCIETPDARRTYADVLERSMRLADGLRACGLADGERVGVLLRNRPEYLEVLFACSLAGLVVVPINRRLGQGEVDHILGDAEVRALVTEPLFEGLAALAVSRGVRVVLVGGTAAVDHDAYEAVVARGQADFRPVEADDDEPQAVYYTSGTTAGPKGVVRSHGANFAMALGAVSRAPLAPGDTWLYAIPAHSAGIYALAVAPLMQGARLLLLPEFEAEQVLAQLVGERVNGVLMVPTMWEMLLDVPGASDTPLPDLRYALWGGMPLLRGTFARLDEWLPVPCLGSYGLTEATCISYSTPEVYRSGRPESSGFPIETMEIRVVDDEGRPVPAGEYGEVIVRGSVTMNGYLNRPDLTEAAMRDGWLHTGDWGRLDSDGALAVVDRKKDMIISGGENIYPAELENSLSQLPGVREVAVVGVPDDRWGQSVCAVVVRSDEALTAQRVLDWCLEHHASYKKPRRVVFLDELPKNSLGKIVKPDVIKAVTE